MHDTGGLCLKKKPAVFQRRGSKEAGAAPEKDAVATAWAIGGGGGFHGGLSRPPLRRIGWMEMERSGRFPDCNGTRLKTRPMRLKLKTTRFFEEKKIFS